MELLALISLCVSCDLVAYVAPPVVPMGGMCLSTSRRATGSVLFGFMHITHFIDANDVCDELLNYYDTSCKVQTLYYNATMYTVLVGAGHAVGSANFTCARLHVDMIHY